MAHWPHWAEPPRPSVRDRRQKWQLLSGICHTERACAAELDALHEFHNPVRGRGEHLIPHVFEDVPGRA
eukprot:6720286-Lingulodinium_polyedra.AAC.1